jgi:hypothetical protein
VSSLRGGNLDRLSVGAQFSVVSQPAHDLVGHPEGKGDMGILDFLFLWLFGALLVFFAAISIPAAAQWVLVPAARALLGVLALLAVLALVALFVANPALTLFLLGALPLLLALYASWARFPEVRVALPPMAASFAAWLLAFVLAAVPLAASRHVRTSIAAAFNAPRPAIVKQRPQPAAPIVARRRDWWWWADASNGEIPPNALAIGQEPPPSAAKLYACHARLANGGVHAGKVAPELGACQIAYGGGEVRVARYQVLVVGQGFTWSPGSESGGMPGGAVVAGHDDPPQSQPLFVCRASYNGGLYPGKTRSDWGTCDIGWGGGEHRVRPYEVLVHPRTATGVAAGAKR